MLTAVPIVDRHSPYHLPIIGTSPVEGDAALDYIIALLRSVVHAERVPEKTPPNKDAYKDWQKMELPDSAPGNARVAEVQQLVQALAHRLWSCSSATSYRADSGRSGTHGDGSR